MTHRRFSLLGSVLSIAFVLLVAGTDASAQELETPRGRQGYYMGLGLRGAGTFGREDGEDLGLWGGSGFALRFGELLTPKLGLGLALEGGGTAGKGQTASYFTFALEGSWTVVRTLALHGTVGVGFLELDDPRVEEDRRRGAAGGVYGLGVSYDFFPWRRLSGGLSLSPTLQARFLPGARVSAFELMAGVDLLWWTGRARNQLVLPPEEAYKK